MIIPRSPIGPSVMVIRVIGGMLYKWEDSHAAAQWLLLNIDSSSKSESGHPLQMFTDA